MKRRPREGREEGAERGLSDRELLGLLLGPLPGAVAEGLPGLREIESGAADLRGLQGIGPSRLRRLGAALELARRLPRARLGERPLIDAPSVVHELLGLELRGLDREVFEVLALDARNALLDRARVSVGTLTGSLVHPREVFRPALLAGAAAVVLVHNHPSGDPRPSAEDRAVTRRLVSAGRLLGIRVLDHVIIGDGRYASLAEDGEALDGTEAASVRESTVEEDPK